MKHFAVMQSDNPHSDRYVIVEFCGKKVEMLKTDAIEFANELRSEAMPAPYFHDESECSNYDH